MKKRHDIIDLDGRFGDPGKDRDLFLEALGKLDAIPDKDESPSDPRPSRRVEHRTPDKRLTQSPVAVLDLHGRKAEEARQTLTRFVQAARQEGERTALVITGKGLRSPGGIAVLKHEFERWARKEGSAFLEAYSEAPRKLGGRGAYILYLRR